MFMLEIAEILTYEQEGNNHKLNSKTEGVQHKSKKKLSKKSWTILKIKLVTAASGLGWAQGRRLEPQAGFYFCEQFDVSTETLKIMFHPCRHSDEWVLAMADGGKVHLILIEETSFRNGLSGFSLLIWNMTAAFPWSWVTLQTIYGK